MNLKENRDFMNNNDRKHIKKIQKQLFKYCVKVVKLFYNLMIDKRLFIVTNYF